MTAIRSGHAVAFVLVTPPLMTQLFGYFTSGDAPIVFPGAAFMSAAGLSIVSLVVFRRALRVEARLMSSAATRSAGPV